MIQALNRNLLAKLQGLGRKQIILIWACICLMMIWIDWVYSLEFLSQKQQTSNHLFVQSPSYVVQLVFQQQKELKDGDDYQHEKDDVDIRTYQEQSKQESNDNLLREKQESFQYQKSQVSLKPTNKRLKTNKFPLEEKEHDAILTKVKSADRDDFSEDSLMVEEISISNNNNLFVEEGTAIENEIELEKTHNNSIMEDEMMETEIEQSTKEEANKYAELKIKAYPSQEFYSNTLSSPCDICEEMCAQNHLNKDELEQLKFLKSLCQYSKLENISSVETWQKQNPNERFVLLTLMEPPSKSTTFKSLHNIARLVQSLDLNFPYQADHLILYDESTPLQMKLLQRTVHRKLIFVNVTSEFEPTKERLEHYSRRTACQGDYSYRAMCRFASGPIYWMSILNDFDYFIRFDEDSYLTNKIQKSIIRQLKQTNSVYGYVLEQPSSSKCRIGLNDVVVDFINQVNHDQFNRPWMRLGDFKFILHGKARVNQKNSHSPNTDDVENIDEVNIQAIVSKKKPLIDRTDTYYGSISLDKTHSLFLTYNTYNCNFEVVDLAYFQHEHYRLFWNYFDDRGLFFKTRMGDHEVKTAY